MRTTTTASARRLTEGNYDEQEITVGSTISSAGNADSPTTSGYQPGSAGHGDTAHIEDLPEFPGKEVLMITVEYPPAGVRFARLGDAKLLNTTK